MGSRNWAYAGVLLGFTASITANIASTVLKQTEVPLMLRIPFAAFWPIATYVAIEVLARTDWATSWSHRLIRLVLAGPVGAVAAFVSYLHQHHLMGLAGEPGLAQGFGPIAVDCLLFGMTATLIVTRPKVREQMITQPMDPAWSEPWETFQESVAPVSPAPVDIPISPASPRAPRLSRSTWDARKVIEMIVDGQKTADIESATGAGAASIAGLRRVVKQLQSDPRGPVDTGARRIPEAHIAIARELASK